MKKVLSKARLIIAITLLLVILFVVVSFFYNNRVVATIEGNNLYYNNETYAESFDVFDFETDRCLGSVKLYENSLRHRMYSLCEKPEYIYVSLGTDYRLYMKVPNEETGFNSAATGDVIDTPTDDIITDMAYPNLNLETLKDIVESAGSNLTWADFSPYYNEEIGSGLYILRYPIDMDYCLMIGGGSMDTSPMYIRLASEYDSENYIDVRTDNIDDFVNTTPKTTSFSYDEVLKTYQENDPGVKYDGFSNTSRTAIENINDVIEQAKNECTVSYTMVNASYDSNNRMWAVLFWSGTPGGGQTVYMDCYGVTSLVVYGE